MALLVTSCPLPPGIPPPYDVTDLVFPANTVQIIPDAAHPDPADIERVGVVVTGRDAEGILRRPLAIQTLTGGGSTWEAVIPDLPMGPQLAFEVTAYGSPPEESELFRGAAGTVVANRWGRVTVTTRYNAPSSAGALVHRIRVRDSKRTVVETDFSIIVAYADTDADVSASLLALDNLAERKQGR